jgi:hypothetical protein
MAYDNVELFSRSDLEAYAEKQVTKAVESDRKINKYKARKQMWYGFEWAGFFTAVIFAVALIAGSWLIYTEIRTPEPVIPVSESFRWIGDSCFVQGDTEYCAVIADKESLERYDLRD